MLNELHSYADEQFCYLTTMGRVTGRFHESEIWFASNGTTLSMLAGGRYTADWVKNIQSNASVQVRIRDRVFSGQGRIVDEASDKAIRARTLVGSKVWSVAVGPTEAGLDVDGATCRR